RAAGPPLQPRRAGGGGRSAAAQPRRGAVAHAGAARGVSNGAGGAGPGWGAVVRSQGGGLDERSARARHPAPAGLGLSPAVRLHAAPAPPAPHASRCRRAGGFSQSLAARVQALQHAHPDATVELWAEDEHRVGLKPILRRVWARRGQRPRAIVRPRYEWEYVYGFVQPETGDTHWLLMPTVNIAAFNSALAHFADQVGAGAAKQILLVVDQAGWHGSPQVHLPAGLHLEWLPASS